MRLKSEPTWAPIRGGPGARAAFRIHVLSVGLVIVALAPVASCGGKQPSFKSFDLTGADYGKALSLIGHDSKPRTLADFQGKLVVLTFGFTHCPDVCPTTLSDAAQAMKSLG